MSEDNLQKALDHFVSSGGLNEDPDMLDVRLHAAFREAAVANRMEPMDMGLGDWSEAKIKAIKIAVHGEICDEKNGKVQEKYLGLMDKATSKEAITWLSSVITTSMVALHLAPLAVSGVVLYLAVWILKKEIGTWCTAPCI